MTSDTPRVDERLRTTSLMNTLDALNDLYDFARQLERELADANAEREELKRENSKLRSALEIVHFKQEPWQ